MLILDLDDDAFCGAVELLEAPGDFFEEGRATFFDIQTAHGRRVSLGVLLLIPGLEGSKPT